QYILRRILQAIPVLLGITIITFTFTELAPGDAVSSMILSQQDSIGEVDIVNLRARYGLDQPAPVRYMAWMGGLFKGNLGVRIRSRVPVTEEIGRRLPATLRLMFSALAIAVVLGIPLGIYSALNQYSRLDYILTGFVFVGISIPGFFAALAVIYVFGVKLDWFPTGGYSTIGTEFSYWGKQWDRMRYLILPAMVLGLESTASIMRYTRSSMLEVIRLEYIVTARAKGLSRFVLIVRHALRNAMLPVITVIGLRLPTLFGGALIIETIFNWPGMGILYLDGVETRDYPLIMGMVLISAVLIVISNLITDLTYAIADPRIRYQ
ncbi:MAG: ABC transporter permease, partial [Caldilineaceae bacterium]